MLHVVRFFSCKYIQTNWFFIHNKRTIDIWNCSCFLDGTRANFSCFLSFVSFWARVLFVHLVFVPDIWFLVCIGLDRV